MTTTLYIIRHGETENNVLHRFQGQTDIPLNSRGLSQAACLSKPMSALPVDAIYCSPFQRTIKTAEAARAGRQITILQDAGLSEIHCGEWETLNREEIEKKWPGMIDLWQNKPDLLHMPGGETFRQVQDRVTDTLAGIVRREKGKHVVIVSHMLTIQLCIARLFSIPIRDVWNMNRLENTSITTMNIWNDTGEFEIVHWGDDAHLPQELRNEYVRIAGFVQKDFVAAYNVEDLLGKHRFPLFKG